MIYLDTSLLVSLYCPDANSVQASALLGRTRKPLVISALCELEAINALGLRMYRREITERQAEQSRQHLAEDLSSGVFLFRAVPESAYLRARELSAEWTPRLGTCTADLLHVAIALELKATGFFSFDKQQLCAAEAVGLKLPSTPNH